MCLPAGRTPQDWKEPVRGWGSRRGSGWEGRLAIAQCESRCLDSPSRYVGQVPSTPKLPSWALITSLYLDGKVMASLDPSPGSHGRLGPQFLAELGLPAPWQCTLCRVLAPIPHSHRNLHEATTLPTMGPGTPLAPNCEAHFMDKAKSEGQDAEMESPAEKMLRTLHPWLCQPTVRGVARPKT